MTTKERARCIVDHGDKTMKDQSKWAFCPLCGERLHGEKPKCETDPSYHETYAEANWKFCNECGKGIEKPDRPKIEMGHLEDSGERTMAMGSNDRPEVPDELFNFQEGMNTKAYISYLQQRYNALRVCVKWLMERK